MVMVMVMVLVRVLVLLLLVAEIHRLQETAATAALAQAVIWHMTVERLLPFSTIKGRSIALLLDLIIIPIINEDITTTMAPLLAPLLHHSLLEMHKEEVFKEVFKEVREVVAWG
jgi:hypothetical protein